MRKDRGLNRASFFLPEVLDIYERDGWSGLGSSQDVEARDLF